MADDPQSALKHVAAEDLPDVVRIASELYSRESERDSVRDSTVAAAMEMDIPLAYMERAAVIAQQERIDKAIAQRRKRTAAAIAACAVVGAAIAGGVKVAVSPNTNPPAPIVWSVGGSVDKWTPNLSPGSQATLTTRREESRGTVAVVNVTQFSPTTKSSGYFVNLDTRSLPSDISRYRELRATVKGNGLSHIRFAFENGNERWKTDVLAVPAQWGSELRVPLDSTGLDYQQRSGGVWHTERFKPLDKAAKLSVKLGDTVNPSDSRGEVAIDTIKID
ncbi:MAG TPA: hypothetical protein VGK19_11270 [Capsulimonadaceae bacterium]|jgi:hypothetical protein